MQCWVPVPVGSAAVLAAVLSFACVWLRAQVTTVYLLAWLALRLLLQEQWVTQENVPGFDVGILNDYLGEVYHIDVAVQDCFDLGWASCRSRQWVVMRHKVKVLSTISPLSNFLLRFQRVCEFTWREYFQAGGDETRNDLAWSAGRRESMAKKVADFNANMQITAESFRQVLTEKELGVLKYYEQRDPSAAVSLNQNPVAGFAVHSSWNALQTLIKNVGIIYSLPHKRFLTPSEGLLAQGFPVLAMADSARPLCSFNYDRPRKRTAVLGQAGNSMNVQAAGLAGIIYPLVNFTFPDTPLHSLVQRMRMVRRQVSV